MNLALYIIIATAVIFIVVFVSQRAWLLAAFGLVIFAAIVYLLYEQKHHTSSYYKFEDPKVEELKDKIRKIWPEIDRLKIYGSNKSITVDKKAIYLCLRDENGEYYPDNMLMYVFLHELAHVFCRKNIESDEGHNDPEFKSIFDDLLERAEEMGIYDSSIPVLKMYCGYK